MERRANWGTADPATYVFTMSDEPPGSRDASRKQMPDMLLDVMAADGERNENVAEVLRRELRIPDGVWDMMLDASDEAARRRPMRAVKRLKDKGLHRLDVKSLRSAMWGMDGGLCVPLPQCLELRANPYLPADWNAEIGDDIWAAAIETVAYMHHPDTYGAGEQGWGAWLEQDAEAIWTWAWVITLLRDLMGRHFSLAAILRSHLDDFRDLEDAASLSAQLGGTEKALADAKQALRDAQAGYQRELASKDKAIARLEHEAQDLRDELASARESLARASQEASGRAQRAGTSEDTPECRGASEGPPGASEGVSCGNVGDRAELPELPATRITVIGGRPQVIAKLRQLHPGWKFLQTSDMYTQVWDYGPMECIFCFTNNISHKLFWTVRQALAGTPIYHVTASNIDRVEREFRERYAEVLAAREGNESEGKV